MSSASLSETGAAGYMSEYEIERAARDAVWARSAAAPTRS